MLKMCQFHQDAYTVGAPRRKLGDFLPIETSWFKTVFEAKRGQKLNLALFAVTRYCLYVNGKMVFNGPQKGDMNTSYVDRLDVSEYLKDGENVLSVKVTCYPPYEAYAVQDGRSNLGPFGVTGSASGPCLMVVSEGDPELSTGRADWRVLNDESVEYVIGDQGFVMGGDERVTVAKMTRHAFDSCMDGFEKTVVRWQQRGDLSKGQSTCLSPFVLYERTLPPMLLEPEEGFRKTMSSTEPDCEKIDLLSGEVTLAPNGRYAVDLDAETLQTGYVLLSMNGGAGARIELRYAEAYTRMCNEGAYPFPIKGRRDDCENFDFLGLHDEIFPDGRAFTFQTFWFRTFRFLRVIVETKDEALTLKAPVWRTTRYPLDVQAKIAPEQDWIANLWDISVRTLELCMHETHEDCPYYEQLQYIFDTRLQMLFTYALAADVRMAERVIFDFHSALLPDGLLFSRYPSTQRQVIPCFALQWIGMLADHYRQTGSDRLIRRYRPTMESILEWFSRKKGKSGLVEKLGYWEFFDWPDEWGPGFGVPNAVLNEGISTDENLVYAYFLETAAQLLEGIGRTQDAQIWRDERAQVLQRIQALCWNAERGLYREGPTTEEYSQHSQVYAVLNDMVQGDAAKALMRKAVGDDSLVKCTYPQQYALFRAMEQAGLYEETKDLWPLWQCLLEQGVTTIPEVPGYQARSDCHAWGALMLFEYPCKILGVTPDLPGFARIGIHPQGLYLGQAQGEVPTPKGKVSVRWTMKDGHFAMHARWPKGVPARITLPDGRTVDSDAGEFTAQ